MASPGLKRPLEFELPSHTTGPSGNILHGSVINGKKRKCNNFKQQSEGHSRSLFRDPAALLSPLNHDISSMIDEELRKTYDDHSKANETPVLTIRQTQIICEKLVRDREQKLREEYDRILLSKLAEQYDTFVKYTHDHIEKRNSHQASYLS